MYLIQSDTIAIKSEEASMGCRFKLNHRLNCERSDNPEERSRCVGKQTEMSPPTRSIHPVINPIMHIHPHTNPRISPLINYPSISIHPSIRQWIRRTAERINRKNNGTAINSNWTERLMKSRADGSRGSPLVD